MSANEVGDVGGVGEVGGTSSTYTSCSCPEIFARTLTNKVQDLLVPLGPFSDAFG
jgi:hypothetical protein